MHPLLLETANRNKSIVDNLFASHEAEQVASSNSQNLAGIPNAKSNNFIQAVLLLGVVILAVKGFRYYHQRQISELEERKV
jgi:hypothetical protein